MPALIASAIAFIASLSGIVIGLGVIIAFIVAAMIDPAGWLNQSIIYVIDMIASIFPSTPNNLKIEKVIMELSGDVPSIGVYAMKQAFLGFRDVFSLIGIYKLYKLIPFKAT